MLNHALLTETVVAVGAVAVRRAVGFDGAQASVGGQKVLGVADMTVSDGSPLPVVAKGTAIIDSGGAVARGDDLVVDAEGRAITAPGVAGEVVFADALQAAVGPGHPIEVLLR